MSGTPSPGSMGDNGIERLRAAVVRIFPALAASTFRISEGWHSVALDVDVRLIFKFPRHAEAERALRREAALLAIVRKFVSMPVPDLEIVEGPPPFSRHAKLAGDHLLAGDYAALPEDARNRLARGVARFYAELHGIDREAMATAGARPIGAWQTPAQISARALPLLDPALRRHAQTILSGFEDLPPDPHGTVYGFFDGHGWNMAFDHARQRLNGIYDFADSGFGPLHQEFIYSNLVAADLTARIIREYEALTGLAIDRRRVSLLTGMHRLSELAELAEDPRHRPDMLRHFSAWAEVDRDR